MRVAWFQIQALIGKVKDVWLPLLIEQFSIQIVIEVSGPWNNVKEIIICIDDMESLPYHVYRVVPSIIPYVGNNVIVDHDSTLHPCERSPHSYSLAFVFEVSFVRINKLPVPVCILWRVFICTNIYLPAIEPW